MTKDDFKFDLSAKRVRISNNELLESLQKYAEQNNGNFFTSVKYNNWTDKVAGSETFVSRFGSWKKALQIIGLEGGRERKYTDEELITNLENIWKDIGFPPGRRQLSKMGKHISFGPYKSRWGSVRKTCELISKYHSGKISREQLFTPPNNENRRETLPLNIRWTVLKRDHYSCVKCGQSPAKNNNIEPEIDHIIPVAEKGRNNIENLQTLCWKCNQGKKDKI